MVRLIQTDRTKELLILEVRKSEMEDILNSIDAMTERHQKIFGDCCKLVRRPTSYSGNSLGKEYLKDAKRDKWITKKGYCLEYLDLWNLKPLM